ncbi:hypothetical protein M5K25_000522 [Dendrobium thyrsiflorum]|uniref:DOMON domain-containing protein n=1 Tax=Dendrobium thyrsiflorum TaxID=117978 RepID=A0ABD0W7N0_DENTH
MEELIDQIPQKSTLYRTNTRKSYFDEDIGWKVYRRRGRKSTATILPMKLESSQEESTWTAIGFSGQLINP